MKKLKWVMLLYFGSGACALIDQVVWVRLLKLTLGNTVYATSIVVSVFLGGLAIGAMIMGRYSDRLKNRLKVYAVLEAIVTISALAIPLALLAADAVYVWFYRAYQPGNWLLMVVQVVISSGILLVPTILMGSTFPLLGRFVTGLEKEAGKLVGKLYAINTLGAAAGCFLAGFVLIRIFGVMGTLYIAAAVNLLVALGGWFLSRQPEQMESAEVFAEQPQIAVAGADGKFYLLVFAFFMSGLISIGYELLWMRTILHLLGGFTYVFSAVLTVYLVGNVIGAGIGSRIAAKLKVPATGFAVTLFLLGLCGIFYMPAMVIWISSILPGFIEGFSHLYKWFPISSYIVWPIVQSLFLFLVPSIIMGIGFPIALQGWANHVHKVGQTTGTAYGANTVGAVAGGIVTGFVLIPLLGVQLSISILGLAGIWIAALMWVAFKAESKLVSRTVLAAAVLFTLIVSIIPTNLFNTMINISPSSPKNLRLVDVKEGVTTTVSLHKDLNDGSLQLYSSGQSIAGDSYVERGDQKMLGHFSVLLKTGAQKVLSVGFGSGETTARLSQHKLEKVDCVEIAPEVVNVSLKYFKHINLGDKLNENVQMIYMDAKNYLHLSDSKYDVIINDSIHPRLFAENSSLYTKEYFENAKQRLCDNGMVISWLPIYEMSDAVFDSIIGTLMDVFPHVTIWYLAPNPAPLVLIIGSQQQQRFSPVYIERELNKNGIIQSLAGINVHNSTDVLSCYIADENDLKKHIGNFSINSDLHPFVEFSTEPAISIKQIFRKFVLETRSASLDRHIDYTDMSQVQKDKWLADYKQLYKGLDFLFRGLGSQNPLEELHYIEQGIKMSAGGTVLLKARAVAEKELFQEAAAMMMNGNMAGALSLAENMIKINPESALGWIIRSTAMQGVGDLQGALKAAEQAVKISPENSDAHCNLGLILSKASRYEEAINEFKESLRLVPQNQISSSINQVQILDALTTAYVSAGKLKDAIASCQKAMEMSLLTGQQDMADYIGQRLNTLRQVESGKANF